jgi:hypothetical protein
MHLRTTLLPTDEDDNFYYRYYRQFLTLFVVSKTVSAIERPTVKREILRLSLAGGDLSLVFVIQRFISRPTTVLGRLAHKAENGARL